MHVLIADDDDLSRDLLERYLRRWGYEVVAAANGAEAWRLSRQREFRMVITDWTMPELDGLELIRRIRESEQASYVYTILLTGRSEKEDIVDGMEAGADDVITKPFDRDELRARVRAGARILDLERRLEERRRSLHIVTDLAASAETPLDRLTDDLTEIHGHLDAAASLLEACSNAIERLSGADQGLAGSLAVARERLRPEALRERLERSHETVRQMKEITRHLREPPDSTLEPA